MDNLITLSEAAKLTKLSLAVFNQAAAASRIQTTLRGTTEVKRASDGIGQANMPKHYLTREEAFRYAVWFRKHKHEIAAPSTRRNIASSDDEMIAAIARKTAELRGEAKALGLSLAEYRQLLHSDDH